MFSIRLTDGRFLFVLLEHKSTPDAETPFQIAEYMLRIWRNHKRREGGVPLVIPIVVYHGLNPWTMAQSITELADRSEDPFRYLVLDLVRTPYSELSPDDDVRGGLGILKYALVEDPSYQDLLESVRILSRAT